MKIFSLSDLHLDYSKEKSMDIFGKVWKNYEERIFSQWKQVVGEDDLVLVAGDISWQMNLTEALIDLKRIDHLPGKKILSKGNHDYWWDSISKLRGSNLSSMSFIQNDAVDFSSFSIAGTRGWAAKDSLEYTSHDEKIFRRELLRLEMSLQAARRKEIICMLHYPPFNRDKTINEFGQILKKYPVSTCIYGHLHSEGLAQVVEGSIEGIEFICTSADYLAFKPTLIKEFHE